MPGTRLTPRRVEKIWGRRDLPPPFGPLGEGAAPVGEIWFEDPRGGDPALLIKYLFTSETLSVQVHPDDFHASRHGARGKDEAWVVTGAGEGALLGVGLREALEPEALRAAALDGSIETLLDWRPAAPGDVYYSPAGTIHAIGANLSLIEVQQNSDITFRLYDYGRDRELHLDEALAVATPGPFGEPEAPVEIAPGRVRLAGGRAFQLERWTGVGMVPAPSGPAWIIPIEQGGSLDGEPLEPGEVWLVDGSATLSLPGSAAALIAYPPPSGHGGRV
jgi:mannose-6-phosphate isomerase